MPHPLCLSPEKTCLVVIDIQEKFRPVIGAFDRVAQNAALLIKACSLMGVEVIATEQYPRGLGATVEPVKGCLGTQAVLEKTSFSCTGAPGFMQRVKGCGAEHAVVCGIETHVCVNQTVLGMLHQGLQVHVAADAVSSRKEIDHTTALRKMERARSRVDSVRK